MPYLLAGDLFDFVWKSNPMNLALLERHAYEERRAGVADWLFVVAMIALLLAIAALPFVARRMAAFVGRPATHSADMPARKKKTGSRVFLLSPANCGGSRAQMVLSPDAQFALAARCERRGRAARRSVQLRQRPVLPRQADLRAPVSRAARATTIRRRRRRARHHAERRAAQPRHARHDGRVRAFARRRSIVRQRGVPAPLEQQRRALRDAIGPDCDVVLLGSIASPKYVDVLLPIFGERLLFPIDFVGRGDMSRGGLLLRCARAGVELRLRAGRRARSCHGARPPKLRRHDGRARRGKIVVPSLRVASLASSIPRDQDNVVARRRRKEVRLTNLRKIFWPELGLTKGDLLQYYADVAAGAAAAHPRSRDGDEALSARRGGRVLLHEARAVAASRLDRDLLDRPRLRQRHRLPDDQDRAALLWVINLGCIDLNQWYATCDDVDRPDYLHFDLDPGAGRDVRPRARDARWSCARRSTR